MPDLSIVETYTTRRRWFRYGCWCGFSAWGMGIVDHGIIEHRQTPRAMRYRMTVARDQWEREREQKR